MTDAGLQVGPPALQAATTDASAGVSHSVLVAVLSGALTLVVTLVATRHGHEERRTSPIASVGLSAVAAATAAGLSYSFFYVLRALKSRKSRASHRAAEQQAHPLLAQPPLPSVSESLIGLADVLCRLAVCGQAFFSCPAVARVCRDAEELQARLAIYTDADIWHASALQPALDAEFHTQILAVRAYIQRQA